MSEYRVTRGCRFRGRRRLCGCTLAAAVALLLFAAFPLTGGARTNRRAHAAQTISLFRRGMWIWYVSQADGGNVSAIISTARRYGVKTLYIKSGDGSGYWSQFSRGLVSRLHSAGLHVCAWQYIYPGSASAEGAVGATAVHNGADCLMIDAEGDWEGGHYVEAQTYIRKLRSLIGSSVPVGLASFPYVDYHPSFPFSVFLGPGGAQWNEPQMYWDLIQVSPDTLYAHTFTYNRPYGRPIVGLGDLASSDGTPPASQIYRFRRLSKAYGSPGVAWWEWSQTPSSAWHALAHNISWLTNYTPNQSWAVLSRGSQGDLVVLAQEHLYAAGHHVTIDGGFGPKTQIGVKHFQQDHRLTPDGVIGASTWRALLHYPAAAVTWTSGGARPAASDSSSLTLPVPKSARLRAKRYEIPPNHGSH